MEPEPQSSNQETNRSLEETLRGLSPEEIQKRRRAEALIQELDNAGILIPLVIELNPNETTVTFRHERDVARDEDHYIQTKEAKPARPVGWLLPFKAENTQAYALIDPDFTISIHFIDPDSLELFQQHSQDQFTPGMPIKVYQETLTAFHIQAVFFHYEDKMRRLLPTNPDHIDRINQLLQTAVEQSLGQVRAAREASQQVAQNTINTFNQVLDRLNHPDSDNPDS